MVLANIILIIPVSETKVLDLYILISVCAKVRFGVQAKSYFFGGSIILPNK